MHVCPRCHGVVKAIVAVALAAYCSCAPALIGEHDPVIDMPGLHRLITNPSHDDDAEKAQEQPPKDTQAAAESASATAVPFGWSTAFTELPPRPSRRVIDTNMDAGWLVQRSALSTRGEGAPASGCNL